MPRRGSVKIERDSSLSSNTSTSKANCWFVSSRGIRSRTATPKVGWCAGKVAAKSVSHPPAVDVVLAFRHGHRVSEDQVIYLPFAFHIPGSEVIYFWTAARV